jgi:hypothetical protein
MEAPQSFTIKALTIWQPWATLIAIGAKQYETRNWRTDYRGPLAVHAARTKKAKWLFWEQPYYDILIDASYDSFKWLPCGKIVAICQLADIIKAQDIEPDLTKQELVLGDFTSGRYAWRLEDMRMLKSPIPARGRQGLWMWDFGGEVEVQGILEALKWPHTADTSHQSGAR